MNKTVNQKAWLLILPVLLLVAFSAVIPLMTVVNYSVQDTFGNNKFFWAGLEWFEEMLASERFGTTDHVFRNHFGHRNPLGHFCRVEHAKEGLLGLALLGPDVAATTHPLECGWHDLADFRPRRYWPSWLYAGRFGDRL